MKAPREFSDSALIEEVKRLAGKERHANAELLRFLIEFDARRLYLGEGYPSLFAYCTLALHYAEHAALNRIEVARAAKAWPVLLEHIANGTIHLSGARLIAPHLTKENVDHVLASACHKSRREIEEIVAALRPKPDVTPTVRRLPSVGAPSAPEVSAAEERSAKQSAPVSAASAMAPSGRAARPTQHPPSRPLVEPLTAERYKVQFTISRETRQKLDEAQDLLRHTIPNGDPAAIFDRALTVLLDNLRRRRFAATERPRASRSHDGSARYIPAAVRREVWQRDGGRCAFVGAGRRCGERSFLEFHHVVPFAVGGGGTVRNIELRCRAHNVYEAVMFFGGEEVGEPAE